MVLEIVTLVSRVIPVLRDYAVHVWWAIVIKDDSHHAFCGVYRAEYDHTVTRVECTRGFRKISITLSHVQRSNVRGVTYTLTVRPVLMSKRSVIKSVAFII